MNTFITKHLVTTHHKHAWEIARDLPLGKYDVVATVSGDGIIHEILNGFAEHKEPIRALRTPLCPIPGGSGNAISLNLLGLEVCRRLYTFRIVLSRFTIGGL